MARTGSPAGIATGAIAALLTTLICLGLAAPAAAKTAEVEVGKVRLAQPLDGRAALLVAVRYPIQLLGHRADLAVSLGNPGRNGHRWTARPLLSGGLLRQPERRRGFTFVHRVDLGPALTRLARHGARVRVRARGLLDANRDGRAELRSADTELATLQPSGGALCSTLPRLRARPGREVAVPLPACAGWVRWRIAQPPERGSARIHDGRLIYRAGTRFRGSAAIELRGRTLGAISSAAGEAPSAAALVTVGSGSGVVVRALGDSVTAGFGYFDNGSSMPFEDLLECRPGASAYNDACSSNSANTNNEGTKIVYAPDYGLANNVSWAAQWANAHGVTNYANLAVSGSEPKDWAPGGQFYETTKQIESEDPDYLLMTVGANPLLSEMLFGAGNIGCALSADILGGFSECIEGAFAEAQLQAHLKSLYSELVTKTSATIYLMGYPSTIPSSGLAYSASQLAMTGKLLNREIAAVATEVSATRLQPLLPPHFNVGVDISPVYPSRYSCSRLGFKVDGPSVQSEPTQDELEVSHPLSFCAGPPQGLPWVISGDTGIHPSAAGYEQMAAQVPAPAVP